MSKVRERKLQIVIPVWQSSESLFTLLDLLGDAYPITIVENASSRMLTLAPKYRKSVQHIVLPSNTGFAHAANVGWRAQNSEFYLFLNPDIRITPEQIEELLAQGSHHSLQAFSPVLVNEQHSVSWNYLQPLPTVVKVLQQFSPLSKVWSSQYPSLSSEVLQSRTLPGACLFVANATLEKIGGWDERFWLWWEDSDFSQRLNDEHLSFGILTNIQVEHQGGESFRSLDDSWKRQVFFHSLQVYAQKHFNWIERTLTSVLSSRWTTSRLYPADENINLSIIVPNLRLSQLQEFLNQNIHFFNFENEELICVTSAHSHELQVQYPQVTFITIPEPIGFAKSVNLGIRRARGKHIGTINDDVVLESGFSTLLGAFEKNTGSVQPVVMNPGQVVESNGVSVLPRGKAEANKEPRTIADTVNAAAVVFSRDALESVGLFDEKFGSYLEDIDLGLRMKQVGFEHKILPDWQVLHFGQQTSKAWPVRKAWQDTKNWWLIVLKPYWWKYWPLHGAAILIERLRNANGLRKVWMVSGRV